jgi:YebC/PmpR family DNA-binding regulatory protein
MSGHNKWSKIKNKKAVTDAQKSKIFGKLVRFITIESKKSGGDINSPGLRSAIEKARAANVPNDNIERAVSKGKSGGEGGNLEQITYEAYGPGGCALIIDALTDNRNKAAQEIKHILSKNGFELAAPGSASWAFTKSVDGSWEPNIKVSVSESDGLILDKLIEELEENDEVREVYTNAE